MRRKLALLLVLALFVSGCTASRAFRRGQDAVRVADWDAAVAHFTEAVQANLRSLGLPITGTEWARIGTAAGIGTLVGMLVVCVHFSCPFT